MPMVVAKQVKRQLINNNFGYTVYDTLFVMEVNELGIKYEHMITKGTVANVYVSRVFNENLEVSMEPRIFSTIKVIKEIVETREGQRVTFFLDLNDLANRECIPDHYFAEVLLTSIANERLGERVIFPNETKRFVSSGLEKIVDEKMSALSRISGISQSHSFLAGLGLGDIAKDLSEGYSRFEIGDYDGAIKYYRKVVEGYRSYLAEKEEGAGQKVFKRLIDGSESRTDKMVEFLSKTFSLLSNFGEHYGTHAYDEEGVFAHKLVENLTEYLTKKLKTK